MRSPRKLFHPRFLRQVLAVILLGWSGIGSAQGAGAGEDMPCPVVIYSTNPNYPPYGWAVGEQLFLGASLELLSMVLPPRVIAKPLVVPWKRALALAEQGRVDLLLSLRKTPERAIYLDFTEHRAFSNPIVVFVRRDRAFPLVDWKDLKGRRGGVSLGDTFGNGFDAYWRSQLQVEEAGSLEENFKKLLAGRIDYFVSGLYTGKSYLVRQGLTETVIPLGRPVSNQDIYFAFSRKFICPSLKAYMERRLAELDRKGIPERLLEKHMKYYSQRTPSER